MKLKCLLNLFVLLALSSCKKENTVASKAVVDAEYPLYVDTTTTIEDSAAYPKDYFKVTIAKDPFKSGDYEFAESVDVYRERFNAFIQKNNWEMVLPESQIIEAAEYNTCTMPLTKNINITIKLSKKDNAVIKTVLFGKDTWTGNSGLSLTRAMKAMIASGPGHRHITADDAEVLLYRIGTLNDGKAYPKGLFKEDGIRYELSADFDRFVFGVSAE